MNTAAATPDPNDPKECARRAAEQLARQHAIRDQFVTATDALPPRDGSEDWSPFEQVTDPLYCGISDIAGVLFRRVADAARANGEDPAQAVYRLRGSLDAMAAIWAYTALDGGDQ